MKKKFWTKRVKIVLIAAVVLAVLVTLGAALSQGASAGRNVFSTLLTPFRAGLAAVDRQAERIYGYIFRYEALLAENEQLKKEMAEQASDVRIAESTLRENQRLKELLNLSQEHEDYSFTSAYVISWSTSNWESRLTIGKGSAHGIEKGMCAITGTGQVVGLVTEVGLNWSTIATIYDVSSQISASLVSSGYTGVVQGARGENGAEELQMRYLSTGSTPKNGDSVVTTGSNLYPRGLLLGTVSGAGLDETGIAKYAALETELKTEGLEQIFLITKYGE